MRGTKAQNGITLIALVITIIILLLLAGVALWALNDGILRNAEHSVNLFNRQANADQDVLNKAGNLLDKYANDLAPDVPDITDEINLPEKRPLSEFPDYIPIYTIAQYAKIGSGEQGYVIQDLTGTTVGTYNMNNNAKYVIMNDLDFSSQTLTEILPEFKGTLEGNGCTIKGIKIDATKSGVAYTKLINEDGATSEIPGGMFVRLSGGTIKNLLVENANVVSNESAGAIVAQSYNSIIDNCYVKNSRIVGGPNAGGILGLDFNGSTITNCKNINTTVDAERLVEDRKYNQKMTGGIVGIAFCSITLENCQTISTGEPLELRGGIIAQAYYYYNTNNNYNKNELISILELSDARAINITNCHSNNLNLNHGTGSAGIIGDIYCNWESNGQNIKTENINIIKCSAKNLIGDGAGIICALYDSSADNGKVKISECSMQNGRFFETRGGQYSNGTFSGQIAGIMGAYNALYLEELEINDCHVKGLYSNSKENAGFTQSAGIVSCIYNTKGKTSIDNCTAEDIHIFIDKLESVYTPVYGYNACGGMIGMIDTYNNIDLKDCEVYKIEIYNKYGHTGGIIGNTRCVSAKVNFENCKASNVDISGCLDTSPSQTYYMYPVAGGIAGNVTLEKSGESPIINCSKCMVNNVKIEKGDGHAGGIIGSVYRNLW